MKISNLTSILSGKVAKDFIRCSKYAPTPLSLKKFILFGKDAKPSESFNFLKRELPVRLANITQEILLLPDRLHETSHMKFVIGLYEKSFTELLEYENLESDLGIVQSFTDCIANIRERHSNVVETVAQGVMEVKERHGIDPPTELQFQYFLDRFYLNRISIRMLIGQHVSLFGTQVNRNMKFIGVIDSETNILEILADAYDSASDLCKHYYGVAPDIRVSVINHTPSANNISNEPLKQWHSLNRESLEQCAINRVIDMSYIPSHLYHMLFELLKNALRAVVEYHNMSDSLPPINVIVCGAQENMTIKIIDCGGGIPHSLIDLVFKYTFTTANQAPASYSMSNSVPMAGYGYGLPLSRLYARYFNGDLTLSSVEGFGTDAIIYLRRKPDEADELLPIFNKTSAKQYANSAIPAADWSNPNFKSGIQFMRN